MSAPTEASSPVIVDPVGPQEIAERLDVGVNTVHRWRQRGRIISPAAIISRCPVWSWPDVAEWAIETGRLDR